MSGANVNYLLLYRLRVLLKFETERVDFVLWHWVMAMEKKVHFS